MDVLEQAVDRAGDALVAAVIAAETEWLAVLNAADDEATPERVADLMEATRQATADLRIWRRAPTRWLRQVRSRASTRSSPVITTRRLTRRTGEARERRADPRRLPQQGSRSGRTGSHVISEQIFDLDGMTPEQIAKATTKPLDALLPVTAGASPTRRPTP